MAYLISCILHNPLAHGNPLLLLLSSSSSYANHRRRCWEPGSSVSIVTRLRAGLGDAGFEVWQENQIFAFSRNGHIGSVASYSVDTGGFPRRLSGRSERLMTYLRPVPKLSMSGAVPPLLVSLHGVCRYIIIIIIIHREAGRTAVDRK